MNKQKEVWGSDFGREYTERNIFSPVELNEYYTSEYGVSRTVLNTEFLEKYVPKDARILEVGCNVANQLRLLQEMGYTNLYGIELQHYAVERAKSLTKGINIIQGVADDMPFKDEYFDLVFTSGVLIHIPPVLLDKVMKEMVRCSSKYIWGFEYYEETFTEVNYRGNTELLWKGDFGKKFVEDFNLKMVQNKVYPYLNDNNRDMMYLLSK